MAEARIILTADGRQVSEQVGKALNELQKFNRGAEGMAAALRKADGGAASMEKLRAAVTDLGGASRLTGTQFDALKTKVAALAAAGAKIPAEFAAVDRALRLDKGKAELAAFQGRVKSLQDQISGKGLRQEMAAISAAISNMGGVSSLTGAQLDQLRSRVERLAAAGAKVPKNLGSLAPGAPSLGGAAVAGLEAQGQGLAASLGPAGQALASLGPYGVAAAAGLALTAGAAATLTTSMSRAAQEAIAYGSAITDSASRSQMNVEAFQALSFAFSQGGASMEDLTVAAKSMQDALVNAPEKFQKLGLSAQQLRQMDPGAALQLVAQSLAAIPDPAERTAVALDVLGKAGPKVAGLAETMGRTAERARELGIVMDQATISGLDKTGDAIAEASRAWDGLWLNLGAGLATTPGLAEAFSGLASQLGSASRFVVENRAALQELVEVAVIPAVNAVRGLVWMVQMAAQGFVQIKATMDAWANSKGVSVARAIADSATFGASSFFGSMSTTGPAAAAPAAPRPPSSPGFGSIGNTTYKEKKAANDKALADEKEFQRAMLDQLKAWDADVANRRSAQEAAAGLLGTSPEDARIEFGRLMQSIIDNGGEANLSPSQREDIRKKLETLKGQMGDLWEEVFTSTDKSGAAGSVNAAGFLAPMLGAVPGALRELDMLPAGRAGYKTRYQDVVEAEASNAAPRVEEAKKETIDWGKALSQVADAFQVLGIKADSTLGRILGGLTAGAAALQSLGKNLAGGLGSLFKGKDGGFSLSGLGGLFKGKEGGFSLSATLGNLGPMMQLGSAALGIGKALVGLFKGDPIKKAQKEIGRSLGVGISRELAETISKSAKELGVSLKTAGLLSLSSIMSEGMAGGKTAASFSGQISELLKLTKDPKVAAKAIGEVGKAFQEVSQEALKSGVIGSQALRSIIRQARELGTEIPEIKEFISEQLTGAAEGVGAGVKGIRITSAEDMRAQAEIANVTFWAVFKEKGLLAAGDAFKEIASSLGKSLEELGGDEIAQQLLGPIQAIVDLGGNELFRGAAEGAQGFANTLKGLANADIPLTTGQFGAFGQQAKAAFDQAVAGGANQEQALLAIAPLLQNIVQAAASYGFELDEGTKALIEQAKASGIAFKTDGTDRLIQSIDALTVALGGVPPKIDEIGRSIGNLPENVNIGVNTYQGTGEPGGLPAYSAAKGVAPVRLKTDTIIHAHAGELAMIVPRGTAAGYVSASGGLYQGSAASASAPDAVSALTLGGLEGRRSAVELERTAPVVFQAGDTNISIETDPLRSREAEERLHTMAVEGVIRALEQRNNRLLLAIREGAIA